MFNGHLHHIVQDLLYSPVSSNLSQFAKGSPIQRVRSSPCARLSSIQYWQFLQKRSSRSNRHSTSQSLPPLLTGNFFKNVPHFFLPTTSPPPLQSSPPISCRNSDSGSFDRSRCSQPPLHELMADGVSPIGTLEPGRIRGTPPPNRSARARL